MVHDDVLVGLDEAECLFAVGRLKHGRRHEIRWGALLVPISGLKQAVPELCACVDKVDVVRAKGRHSEGVRVGISVIDTDVVAENMICCEGRQDLDTAWVCTLKRVPSFVRALDATPVSCDIFTRTRKAAFSDVFELFTMCLQRMLRERLSVVLQHVNQI